jgi:hypothetical protein
VQLLSTRLDWVPCGWIAIVDGISCACVASHRTAAACVELMGPHTAWGSKLLVLTPRLCYLETLRQHNFPWCSSPRCYDDIIFVDFASVLSFCRELQGMNAGDEKVLLKGQITKQREQIILKAKAATAGWDAAAQSDERYCARLWLWWCSLLCWSKLRGANGFAASVHKQLFCGVVKLLSLLGAQV